MELIYWWLPVALVLAGAWPAARWWRRRRAASDTVAAAHTERMTALPGYRRALGRHRRLLLAATATAVIAVAASLMLAGRPASRTTTTPQLHNRDILLCLDVSGSMLEADARITETFTQLASGFRGERLGLVIFDGSAAQVFPLTDDYDYVQRMLSRASKAFRSGTGSGQFFAGTYSGEGSSLIGDGLATCATSFGAPGDDGRSRSIVLATDNLVNGNPIYTLSEATELAAKAGINVYALNPNDYSYGSTTDAAAAGLRRTARTTGGAYFALEDEAAVSGIIDRVERTETAAMDSAPVSVVHDRPAALLFVLLAAVAGLYLLMWRLRR